ncbi:Lysine biosynthesis regulatory protein LYS14 [Candida viswanathii]|uniref:Lysine biosynthesis regulatory protein LYS14 n=1 Tax=Candida viswanathii TaxID=5486 RepID=A0A367YR81_9ASCO|nr:Lysine biosynthesis regulatory protein LYS14 [Candida viswanathii]
MTNITSANSTPTPTSAPSSSSSTPGPGPGALQDIASGGPKRIRKSYSRNGCRECKRRKIRCPEEKPFCSTCVRLGKQCSYPLAGEKVLRISRRLIKEEIENMGKTTQFLPVQYDIPKRIKIPPSTPPGGVKQSPLNIENLINNNDFLSGTDLSSLTTDLNNLVTDIMEGSNIPFLEDDFQFDFLNESFVVDEITKNIPIDYIKLPRKHEQLYWEEFYNNFAQIIEPFQAYHSRTKTTSNPARDIILHTAASEPFLLAAVLAEGANTCYLKYKRPEDERAYGAYLSKCLKLLEPARETDLNANIEAVLLTLLLLTAATATSQTLQWRPHLVGAKTLLIKAFNQNVSKKFVFCKYWFLSIEILAGLSTSLGGTLQTDYEIDRLMTPGNEYEVGVLREIGIITDQGFNILMGFDNSCIACFGDLLKVLNKKRFNIDVGTMEYVKLVSAFYAQSNIVYIDSRGVIPEKDLTRYIPGLPIEELRVNNASYWISWQDISHQSYVLLSIIMILTRFFVIDVSQLVDQMILFIHYLNQFSDVQQHASPYLLLMIQWPLLVTGLSTTKLEQRSLLLKYFSMVGAIGAASSQVSTQILIKHWKGTIDTTNDDTLIY